MLRALREIMLQVKQGLLSVIIIRVKGIWQDSALINTQPKRQGIHSPHGSKEKRLLVQAQESGQVLDDEQLAFLADPGVVDVQVTQTKILLNVAFQTDDLDAYDSDCDDISSAKAVLMANLSSYGSDVLFEITQHDTYQNDDMLNQSVQEIPYFE
ncbi:hypothetical protein Tco_0721909 [Tanacetum coccineum]